MFIQDIYISKLDAETYLSESERMYLNRLLVEIRRRKSKETLKQLYYELENLKQEIIADLSK